MAGYKKKLPLTNVPPICPPDCPNRAFDCHGKCKDYADYQKRCEEEREKRLLKCQVTEAKEIAVFRNMKRKR